MERRFDVKQYNMDDVMSNLAEISFNHTHKNIILGYKTYYYLEKYIRDNDKDPSILFDLSNEFESKETLYAEVSKLAAADGRFDLIHDDSYYLAGYAIKTSFWNDGDKFTNYKLNTNCFVNFEALQSADETKLYSSESADCEVVYLLNLSRLNEEYKGMTFEKYPVYRKAE